MRLQLKNTWPGHQVGGRELRGVGVGWEWGWGEVSGDDCLELQHKDAC